MHHLQAESRICKGFSYALFLFVLYFHVLYNTFLILQQNYLYFELGKTVKSIMQFKNNNDPRTKSWCSPVLEFLQEYVDHLELLLTSSHLRNLSRFIYIMNDW